MRQFQSKDGKRFWNIDMRGSMLTTSAGNVGTEGRTSGKQLSSPSRAKSTAEKLIREKQAAGYVERKPRSRNANEPAASETAASVPSSEVLAFEKALKDKPDDKTGWLAYADYLTEHNDPRGEFIQVQIALEDELRPKSERKELQQREKELLREHEREWLGELAEHLLDQNPDGEPPIEYQWRRGFLASIAAWSLSPPQAQALGSSPQARFLAELHLHGDLGSFDTREGAPPPAGVYAHTDELERLAESPSSLERLGEPRFPHLRVFRMGSVEPDENGWCNCYCSASGLERVVAGMTCIEELHLLCQGYDIEKLFALRNLTRLRVLRVYHLGVRGSAGQRSRYEYPLDVLAQNPAFKNLTHLLFHPHIPEYHHSSELQGRPFLQLEQIRTVLRSKNLPNLTHLQLRLTDMGDEGVREIIASGILKRLKWLDLRHGCITDEGAKLFAQCPDTRNLERLDLSRNGVTAKGLAELRKAKVNAVANQPLSATELTQMRYLYEGDGE